MKINFNLLIVSLILFSCSTPQVYSDYVYNVEFDEYESFAFYAIENSSLARLDEDRIYEALQDTLTAKGFERKLIPDFKINFYAEVFDRTSNSNFGVGLDGYSGGASGPISPQNAKRTIALTIEFADGLTNDLFWQGIVETKFNENLKGDRRKEFFRDLIGKVLEKYPPGK